MGRTMPTTAKIPVKMKNGKAPIVKLVKINNFHCIIDFIFTKKFFLHQSRDQLVENPANVKTLENNRSLII